MLFNSFGIFILFKYEQILVKKEIKRRIKFGVPANERLLFAITKQMEENKKSDFKRVEKGEFEYKGEMYDILYEFRKNDTTYIIAIHDPKETNLFAQLNNYISKYNDWDTHHNPLAKSKKHIKKFLKDYLPDKTFQLIPIQSQFVILAHYLSIIKKIFISIDTPPPCFG